MDSIVVEALPGAAIGSDVVVPFGATGVAAAAPVDSVEVVPVDSAEAVPAASVDVAPVEALVDSVVAPLDSAEDVPVTAVLVDSVVVAPSVADALVEVLFSAAEPDVPSVEDEVVPEALDSVEEEPSVDVDSLEAPSDEDGALPDSLEVLSEEDALLPDSLATPVFSFVPSLRVPSSGMR